MKLVGSSSFMSTEGGETRTGTSYVFKGISDGSSLSFSLGYTITNLEIDTIYTIDFTPVTSKQLQLF